MSDSKVLTARANIGEFLEYFGPFMDDAAGWMDQACTDIGLPLPFSHAETLRRMHSELVSLAAGLDMVLKQYEAQTKWADFTHLLPFIYGADIVEFERRKQDAMDNDVAVEREKYRLWELGQRLKAKGRFV